MPQMQDEKDSVVEIDFCIKGLPFIIAILVSKALSVV